MNVNFPSILKSIHQKKSCVLGNSEIAYLVEMAQKYPYFQIAHYLIAQNSPDSCYIQNSEIYFLNNKFFSCPKEVADQDEVKQFDCCGELENREVCLSNFTEKKNYISQEVEPAKKIIDEKSYQVVRNYHGTYIDEISKMQSQSINDKKIVEQFSVISEFIKNEDKKIKINNSIEKNDEDIKNEACSDNDLAFNGIPTVSLFRIYMSQGKIEAALNIYAKIVAKNPEKKVILDSIMDQKSKNL